jgi:polysaccharide export outer membrane protein
MQQGHPKILAFAIIGLCAVTAIGQSLDESPPPQPGQPAVTAPAYRLGSGDEVIIQVLDVEEISDKPQRIDSRGNLSLPLVGRVPATGLTVEELETVVAARLGRYLRDPQVTLTIAEVRSQPVSVLGAVNRPGVHQIEGPKTLVEILSLAGGLREDAGHTIKITRRAAEGPIPLASAQADSSGNFSVAEVNVREVMEARRPENNIFIRSHDVISVPRAEMVYVIGEVEKSGGFVLEDRQSVSVLQALSLAGGLTDVAAIENSRILRGNAGDGGGERLEIAVDLKAIMAGKSPDVPLEREDILFVPRSGKRAASQAVKRAAVGTLSGIAIWRIGAR